MRNLLSAALIAVTLTAAAQINTVGREEYKEWKYFASEMLYANTTNLSGYTGWAAMKVDAEGYDPIVYVYICSLTEGTINRILTFLTVHCHECSVVKQLTYMPDGYSLYDAGDLYLAARLDSGYAVWNGYAQMNGARVEITYSVKNENNLLFIRFIQ